MDVVHWGDEEGRWAPHIGIDGVNPPTCILIQVEDGRGRKCELAGLTFALGDWMVWRYSDGRVHK